MSEFRNPGPNLRTRLELGDAEAALAAIRGLGEEKDARIFHEVSELTESGKSSPAGEKVADLAATALIDSLRLQPSFSRKVTGYSAAELAEVRKLVIDSVPR